MLLRLSGRAASGARQPARLARAVAGPCLAVALLACGADDGGADAPLADAGQTDAALPQPTSALSFTAGSMVLLHGEAATLEVRYVRLPEGRPVVGEPIMFGLVGEAHDSSLEGRCGDAACLAPLTNGAGVATATLRGGDVPAVFRVQARAPDGSTASLDVTVSDGGNGELVVRMPYAGARDLEQRHVRLFADARCGADWTDLLGRTPDRARQAPSGADRVPVPNLPASRRYTVLAIGRGALPGMGASRPTLALGCRDDVEVVTGDRVQVDVPLEDLALVVDGVYTTRLVVTGTAHATRVRSAVNAVGAAAVDAAESQVDLVLDHLAATLAAEGRADALEALEAARAGTDDDALRARLESARQRPLDASAWLAETLADASETLRVEGQLAIAIAEPAPAVWSPAEMTAGGGLMLPSAMVGGPPVTLTVDWQLPHTATLRPLVASLPLGSTAVATLGALLADRGADSTAELLADEVGCSALAAWVAARPAIAAGCDAACATRACEATYATVSGGVEAELRALDALRAAVTVSTSLSLTEGEPPGLLGGFGAEAAPGTWAVEAGGDGDPVSVAVSGARGGGGGPR